MHSFVHRVGRLTERVKNSVRRPIENPDERTHHPAEKQQRRSEPFCESLRMIQRRSFWCELTKHDVQVGENGVRDNAGDRHTERHFDSKRQAREQPLENSSESFLRNPAEAEARERYTKLARRENAGD